jgi:hypothetical protein
MVNDWLMRFASTVMAHVDQVGEPVHRLPARLQENFRQVGAGRSTDPNWPYSGLKRN